MNRRIIAGALLLLAVAWVGCESTQSKSAKLEANGADLAKVEKVKIGAENKSIELVDQTLLTDQYGSAVVLELKNDSGQGQADIPIAINALNAKGKPVYQNNVEGLEAGLLGLGLIGPGETAYWVHDQVMATSKPVKVEATIGTADGKYPAQLPEIVVSPPTLENDPVSGKFVSGTVVNKSSVEQVDLLLSAVALKGGKVVAAGRGLIPKLKTDGKPESYRIYFIGDPTGARIQVTAPPTKSE